jgi:hypothetical protein
LEHKIEEGIYVAGDGNEQGGIKDGGAFIKIFPLRGPSYDVEIWEGTGGHGGGDDIMLRDIFSSLKENDKYLRFADQRAGAYSILTGIAANHSMISGEEILIENLVKNIRRPDYTPMPDKNEKLEMPQKY